MVSKPTGFVYVVSLQWSRPVSAHISQTQSVILFTCDVSNADQLEALLTRWGPGQHREAWR